MLFFKPIQMPALLLLIYLFSYVDFIFTSVSFQIVNHFFLVFLHELKHYFTTISSSLNPKALVKFVSPTNFLLY